MIFLAGSEASGKTKKAFAYGWKERKTSEDGVLLFSLQHEKKEMWKILQSMYGQEELSKIEIDDTPAIMVERMAEIIAPVSYTHLDVYKRQRLTFGGCVRKD